MKRVKEVVAVVIAAVALPALLTACSEDITPIANTQTPRMERAATSGDAMPEVVITAQRERAQNIILSEREAGSVPASVR